MEAFEEICVPHRRGMAQHLQQFKAAVDLLASLAPIAAAIKPAVDASFHLSDNCSEKFLGMSLKMGRAGSSWGALALLGTDSSWLQAADEWSHTHKHIPQREICLVNVTVRHIRSHPSFPTLILGLCVRGSRSARCGGHGRRLAGQRMRAR